MINLHLLNKIYEKSSSSPQTIAIEYLKTNTEIENSITYRELTTKIHTLSEQILSQVKTESRVAICIESDYLYLIAFLACLQAGVIAIPSLSPRNQRNIGRIINHIEDSTASLVLYDERAFNYLSAKPQLSAIDEGRHLVIDDVLPKESCTQSENMALPNVNSTAYLQYTSGSTRSPKGVMISHENLSAQLFMLSNNIQGAQPNSYLINWMPLYHDFGLIMSLLSLYVGGSCILLPASRVIHRPTFWLEAISNYQASISACATFMLELCSQKYNKDTPAEPDLSSLKSLVIGAEPINANYLNHFKDTFQTLNLNPDCLTPAYGMAEATLILSINNKTSNNTATFNKEQMSKGKVIAAPSGKAIVSCGKPAFSDSMIIVNPDTHNKAANNTLGEIWVKTPSIGLGYWLKKDETEAIFRAHVNGLNKHNYMRTGDLGFFHEEELFIVGRIKDTIIINGENRYPQDIEWSVQQCHEALEFNSCTAFSIDHKGLEKLIITQELTRTSRKTSDLNIIFKKIRQTIISEHGLDPDEIILLQPKSLEKTSSGKVQRQKTKQQYSDNNLQIISQWKRPINTVGNNEITKNQTLTGIIKTLVQRILLIEKCGMSENLLAYGAESIKVLDLLTSIEERFNVEIDPVKFSNSPTIDTLNMIVSKEIAINPESAPFLGISFIKPLEQSLISKQQKLTLAWDGEWISLNRFIFGKNIQGSRQPIFWCFQGYQEFQSLAEQIGHDQPIYGMRSAHQLIPPENKDMIAQLANIYAAELLMLESITQDDYILGGNCQGGLLITRIAQLIYASGKSIHRLLILENIANRLDSRILPFPVSLFFGEHSMEFNPLHQFHSPFKNWENLYPQGYSLDILPGKHGEYFRPPALERLANYIRKHLDNDASNLKKPLSYNAFKASINIISPKQDWIINQINTIIIEVTNTSHMTWPKGKLSIANHWYSEDETVTQWLDGHILIEKDIHPQEIIVLPLSVNTPGNIGHYKLVIDIAEMGITWFSQRAEKSTSLNIKVHGTLIDADKR